MKLLTLIFALAVLPPESAPTVNWSISAGGLSEGMYELVFEGELAPGWHTYGTGSKWSGPVLSLDRLVDCEPEGGLYDLTEPIMENGEPVFYGKFRLGQALRVTGGNPSAGGSIGWTSCEGKRCHFPETRDFDLTLGPAPEAAAEGAPASSSESVPLLSLVLEAILWGLAMLLTPCVFPMVPMTVSFFLKSGGSPSAGRFKAFMYGLCIVLLYTVPIGLIILITRLAGGDAVTADIFNWLATHWLPNILFFVIFMLFAASFFGAFEITLPSSLVNRSDSNSDRGGLAGVFFMALTLVLVSFSCTGPIVGSVLIRSTRGEFWAPVVTMLAFSVAFALPFTLFALFPQLLKKLRSGSWLGSVKIVLGFVELALGFKFLSVADQTYHWGILDREVYLAIWITVFSLLGLYLLGKIRFKGDALPDKPLSVFRLGLVIAVFSFVVYMIPGMWGAPLKALSGYLPPLSTQDFVLGAAPAPAADADALPGDNQAANTVSLPFGLVAYTTVEDGLRASAESGRPLFVDITGHGCVNCREMEQRVWSDPEVLSLLRDRYVIVALYTDDKTRLPESSYLTVE
ncbi:MAG: thioredoxin family protein, partial [Bacteroidales bacterium]|nr:thioredoxin family protein [Bacteroidales bacterium]